MKLTLLSPYGSKSQLLAHHIQQRLERPHVPLKFSAVYESDDHEYLVSVIRNPKDFVASEMLNHTNKQLHEHIESCKSFYNHSLVSANLMVEYDQIDKDIDGIIKYIYDALKLDSQNYLTKTGRVLSDDVLLQPEHEFVVSPEPDLAEVSADLTELEKIYSDLINSEKFIKLVFPNIP